MSMGLLSRTFAFPAGFTALLDRFFGGGLGLRFLPTIAAFITLSLALLVTLLLRLRLCLLCWRCCLRLRFWRGLFLNHFWRRRWRCGRRLWHPRQIF